MSDYITMPQACELYGITQNKIYQGAETGRIRTIIVRSVTQYHRDDVLTIVMEIRHAEAARIKRPPPVEAERAALSARQRLDDVLAARGLRASGGRL